VSRSFFICFTILDTLPIGCIPLTVEDDSRPDL
jgi:hypothetical protein